DLRFYDVPRLLPQQSMLVYNNTRVINARLRFQKPNAGAIIEIFCLEPIAPRDYAQVFQTTSQCSWLCFVGNSKRWKAGSLTQVVNVNGCEVELAATRGEQKGNAFEIIFSWNNDNITFASLLEAIGEIPIPPYLNRNTEESDSADYQTVYSHIEGSVAAPTAGLHFTDEVLAECDRQGISRRELTLHVGAGTFQPVKSESIGEHDMHTEFISVEKSLLVDLIKANGNVIAVGTTSVRTLESLYYIGITLLNNPDANEEELRVKQWAPYQQDYTISTADALQAIIDHLDRNGIDRYIGSTQIMIAPSFKFRVIRGMITNFHQPQSTLLLLVSAFVDGNWKAIYDYALSHDYRFLSYGDSSLLLR
ncbi:MAG: S-adenosylmethionine:tRNA ribosyltransferase-isomerase, partial [Bacteroidales bacterium]|nr:S-adenosylmethionine:tRNA ribosyltransferase-isomerase [Bacteroidales bacterium]